jgi:monoamine oxidase
MTGIVDILIVGGGAAGIAAARRLQGLPYQVLLVEAGDRLGGRACTQRLAGQPFDLGCGWLHSADRNPWARLAEAEGREFDKTPPAWQQQWQDIGFTPAEQKAAGASYDAFQQRLREAPPASDRAADALLADDPWNAYLDAVSGFINGAQLAHLSVADYLAYDAADTNVNWRLPEGYGALVAEAATALPVALGTPVERIDRTGPLLRAEGPAGAIEARCVIVAVPTNVIAGERLRFDPPLPEKCDAAAALPLGLANKVLLGLDRPEPFEPDTQLIGNPRDPYSGAYYLRPFGRPAIEAFLGGAGACGLEAEGVGAAADFAIEQLVALLGSGMRRRLTVLAETRWGADPLFGGSYSHALPGRAGARAQLARPVENRIFFAGEACSISDFSTAHGAWETGAAAAEAAMSALS